MPHPNQVPSGQTMKLHLFRFKGCWAFNDPVAGLENEQFVKGMTEIIDNLVSRTGFTFAAETHGVTAEFGLSRFETPGRIIEQTDIDPATKTRITRRFKRSAPLYTLTWLREDDGEGGNWYVCDQNKLEGWLCPALFAYFPTSPSKIYFSVTIGRS
jgi:hypothetical protein